MSRCLFATLCFMRLAFGQTSDTATLRGKVIDESGGTVANVRISAKNGQLQFTRTAITDEGGRFSIYGLPVSGAYMLEASKPGFSNAILRNTFLAAGTTISADIVFRVAADKSELTVSGAAGDLRPDEPQLGLQLRSGQAGKIPLLNRRITYLPLLNSANRPALNQGDVFINQNLFTSNGTGRRQTWFEIDGSTGSDIWGRQTIFTNIPLAAVEEMDILTNAFSAEYGNSGGSAVNIITKSGSNQFHGDLLALARPAETSAALSGYTASSAANGNSITGDQLYQGAFSLSGPVGRSGNTQFFSAAEFSAQNRTSPITSPIAPGEFTGRYRNLIGLLRIDHQFNPRNHLFFRSSADGFYDMNPNGTVGGNSLPSVGRVFRRRTYSEEIGETATLSPRVVSNLRLQFQLASPITQFDPIDYGTQFIVPTSLAGRFTAGTSQSALLMNRQYQAAETVAASLGAHQLRFGASFIYVHTGGSSKEFGGPLYLGQLTYKTCTQALAFCEGAQYLSDIRNVASYTQSYGASSYIVNDRLAAGFLQDDYHVRPGLTVNLGLRYEYQSFADSTRNFAPRAGFAYTAGSSGRTVVRGGFGIYHSQILDNAQANYTLSGPAGVFNYSAAPGQIGFPSSITAVPLPALPSGALPPVRSLYVRPGNAAYLNRFFPVDVLPGYPRQLLRPYTEQCTFGVEQRLGRGWVLSTDYVGSHSLRINRNLDINAPQPFIRTAPGQVRTAQAANCTRPYWIDWYQSRGLTCNPLASSQIQPPYSVIQSDVNNGHAVYHALNLNLNRRFANGVFLLASYTWSHTLNNVDPDVPGQNPNDPNFTSKAEYGNAIFDQRHRFVASGVYTGPWRILVGGIVTLASGLPYNFLTGLNNSGDTGATADRPVIDGVVVGRNIGRGGAIYEVSPFLERTTYLGGERPNLVLRAEAFNVFNRANFVGYSGIYGNGNSAPAGFGQPLAGITNQLPARSFQFSARLGF